MVATVEVATVHLRLTAVGPPPATVLALGQQHSEKEGLVVVVVEDFSISDLDDSSNLDCICCLKDHNYSAVVGLWGQSLILKANIIDF